jgi:hypothetical protein
VRLSAFAALAAAALLMGCWTSPNDAAVQTVANQNDAQRNDLADDKICIGYGTTPGTAAYSDCRMKLAKQREIVATQARQAPIQKNCPTEASGISCAGF